MELAELTARNLVAAISCRSVSAREVVEAHIRQIEDTNDAVNAVVIPLFESALDVAEAADEARLGAGRPPPLDGLPVTVKECFDVAGTPSTVGVRVLRDRGAATADSLLVRQLREAGAIIVGKTNVPQLMWFNEADNPLYGRTNNPWDLDRGPGGSSGGEGAVIAVGGSRVGFGTDSGGSIRTPAAFCGVHALKPTDRRLSSIGTVDERLLAGQEAIVDQPGPLSRNVDDLAFVMEALTDPRQASFDPFVPLVPWREPEPLSVRGLRVGVFVAGGPFIPSRAVTRVVEDAAKVVAEEGANVVEFVPPLDFAEAKRMYDRIFSADGGENLQEFVGDSELDWRIERTLTAMRALGPLSSAEWFELIAQRTTFRSRFVELLDEKQIDVLICPPYALPALPHGASANDLLEAAEICSALFNIVGLPAGVVAASRVRRGEDTRPATDDPAVRAVDEGSVGLPVGVQVAARHWREDLVLTVMSVLERHFSRHDDDYPAVPPLGSIAAMQ